MLVSETAQASLLTQRRLHAAYEIRSVPLFPAGANKESQKGAPEMLTKQHQIQAKEKEVHRDPRIGQRVICCSLLPTITLLGTIQRISTYASGEEYWHVLTDGPMTEEAPASCFLVYDGPEFAAGARVRYRVGLALAPLAYCLSRPQKALFP